MEIELPPLPAGVVVNIWDLLDTPGWDFFPIFPWNERFSRFFPWNERFSQFFPWNERFSRFFHGSRERIPWNLDRNLEGSRLCFQGFLGILNPGIWDF